MQPKVNYIEAINVANIFHTRLEKLNSLKQNSEKWGCDCF